LSERQETKGLSNMRPEDTQAVVLDCGKVARIVLFPRRLSDRIQQRHSPKNQGWFILALSSINNDCCWETRKLEIKPI